MTFTLEEKSPITEKILGILMTEEKLSVEDFRDRISKLRITKKECEEIERYLNEKGYISRERGFGKVFIVATL